MNFEDLDLLDEKAAAAALKMSLPWLRARRQKRLAPTFLKIGSRVLYRASDLQEFVEKCAVQVREDAP